MGERIRAFDWASTSLGRPEDWPRSLKTAVRIMLASRQPIWIGWGRGLVYLYNDPYRAILGGKHPRMLGQRTAVVWREIWEHIAPMLEVAMQGGEGTYVESQLLVMERNGYPEETYYTFSYTGVPDDDGGTGGIICANTDDTHRVISERQLGLLRELAASLLDVRDWRDVCERACTAFATDAKDLPFAALYMVSEDGSRAELCGTSGIEAGHTAAPHVVALDDTAPWPFAAVMREHAGQLVADLDQRFRDLPRGPWPRAPHAAAVLPIATNRHRGMLVVGLNPFRLHGDEYAGFLSLAAGQIAAAIATADAYAEERRRVEALAELDRAKTQFFSNVSHEFRTPLTLILGPVEDMLRAGPAALPPPDQERLDVVHRNALRLMKLVNTMLDFARIEAGRVQADYEAVELPEFTAELASVFRAAVERAGLRMIVDTPPFEPGQQAFVDRDMWEKILLNLLSNAFKFTLQGEIEVGLAAVGGQARLTVRDTGVGIPAAELPRMFERFHRVKETRGRTHEGTGIGLALVHELVKLHGGTVAITSELDRGTTVVVTVPLGTEHLDPVRVRTTGRAAGGADGAAARAYVGEALRWLPDAAAGEAAARRGDPVRASEHKPRVLWADDNADMREYVARLLAPDFRVEAVADGQTALDSARREAPDLVLADVMMPRLDGPGLLRELRADPALSTVPVILLSARAGEEARVEGMQSGADDYLVKPFSARELIARVASHVRLARFRRDAALDAARSEARFRSLFHGAQVAIAIADRDRVWTDVNTAMCTLLGRDREALLGRSHTEIVSLGVPERAAEVDAAIDATGHWRGEVPLMRSDGAHRVVDWQITVVPESGLRLAVAADVTERRRAEEALRSNQRALHDTVRSERSARAELERVGRLKDEFLATLSHELRTPLNAIVGWSEILSRQTNDTATVERGVQVIQRNARAQADLIADLLDMSRIISGKLRLDVDDVDLADVVRLSIDSVRHAAEAKDIRIQTTLGELTEPIRGDAGRLQQVLWNLLSNAVKFTPVGGRIHVSLARVGSHLELTVVDSGIGIAAAFVPYLFERFRQEDSSTVRRHGGLGLGLSIVKHLVELHGGTVRASSDGENKGTTFVIQLPVASARHKAGAVVAGERVGTDVTSGALGNLAADLRGVVVLAIDDQEDARELIRRLLEDCNAQVVVAGSAEQGLSALLQHRPDVVLCDIGMPGEDGYAFIRDVRARGIRTPAVAVTAFARVEDRARALRAGFQGHLAKPLEPAELVATVAAFVHRSGGEVVAGAGA